MQLAELVTTSREVASTRKRSEKVAHLARGLARLAPGEREAGAAWLAGELLGGKLGLGPATVWKTAGVPAAVEPELTVAEVAAELGALRELSGPGSQAERVARFERLLARCTAAEQDFLRRLVVGELRQGALLSLLLDALAQAADVPPAAVRRAHMFSGSLAPIVSAAFEGGAGALTQFDLVLFEPVQPMLALPATDLDDALARLDDPYLELKMDGARVQIHRDGEDVRIFTRKLNDVTASLPDIVAAVSAAPRPRFVLDGEVIALDPDRRPYSFQTTMKRFGRVKDVAEARARIPLSLFAFDCLHVDGATVVDRPASERLADLETWLPDTIAMPRVWSPSTAEARAFVARAYAGGHEGAMAKAKDSTYDAGRRGGQWLKLKQAFTVDLVVLGAEWGSGRREGWLSNLHLGALGDDGAFVMVGKTFKGLTDAMLRDQTEALLARATGRERHGVTVRPELVVEVAIGGVQASGHYPGGVSLRFARVRRYRSDKRPHDVETLGQLRDLVTRSG